MKTVLIVDDQPEVLRLYSRGLEVSGYRVVTAESVDAGMQIVEADPAPDAVLVDLKMPFVNGMGMLYRLRKTHPKLPVAIITGMQNLDKEALQEITMLDAAIHYKPLSITQMRQIVDTLLGKEAS
ncbi:MAG TPA: response regulator [Vicinamibacterales bacterium]|nr:response regulator [Vicinamibacterales bacterium]